MDLFGKRALAWLEEDGIFYCFCTYVRREKKEASAHGA